MAVFPESMGRIDPMNAPAALKTMENYIRYMCERMEFSASNTVRNVSAAGVSSVELFVLVSAQEHKVSALESKVNLLEGEIAELASQISSAISKIQELEGKSVEMETRISALE